MPASETRPVAVVSGGTRGIGRAVVEEMIARGYVVAFLYRSRSDLAAEISAIYGDRVFGIQAGVEDNAAVLNAVRSIRERLGRVDVLVNNAAILRRNYFPVMSNVDWQSVIDVSLNGLFYLTKAIIKIMIAARRGVVINISSIAGLRGSVGQINYVTAKGGMIAFTQGLAQEMGRFGIRVNAVAPGLIETDMLAKSPSDFRAQLLKTVALGRVGTPQEVARIIAFLASDDASYVTGATWVVDGGAGIC